MIKHFSTVDVVKGDIIDTKSSCLIHSKWIRFDPPSPMIVPNATNYINSTLVAGKLRIIFNSTGLSDRVRQTDSETLNTIREQMGNAAATENDVIQRLDRMESESLLSVIFEFIKSACTIIGFVLTIIAIAVFSVILLFKIATCCAAINTGYNQSPSPRIILSTAAPPLMTDSPDTFVTTPPLVVLL